MSAEWSPFVEINSNDVDQAVIFAKLLIPGRGNPVRDAAVGISTKDGSITYAGPQSKLPKELQSIAPTHVPYLLPGLWDCHTHFAGTLQADFGAFVQTHPAACGAAIARGFHDTIMAGFTSVRDVGSFALEAYDAVKAGLILGPTVYGAGAAIGITGGSCDSAAIPVDMMYGRQGVQLQNQQWPGTSTLVLADGIEECRRAVRLQIRRGAKCIKVVSTGGVMSTSDDPEYRQFSDAELETIITEAKSQGRAVASHAHGKAGIMASIRLGAHTIEHGSYLDQEAALLMREKGTTLVATRHIIEAGLKRLDKMPPATATKMVAIAERHLAAYRTAVQTGVKIALGTDICSSNPNDTISHGCNGHELVWAVRRAGMSPRGAIEAATINAAETLGPQAPRKGLVQQGWDADLIALDENPLDNIDLFAKPSNIKYVWKMGQQIKSPHESHWTPPAQEINGWAGVDRHSCVGCQIAGL
ncbi:hypothetical protein ACHAPJ_008947 [Fusarium lateritium]